MYHCIRVNRQWSQLVAYYLYQSPWSSFPNVATNSLQQKRARLLMNTLFSCLELDTFRASSTSGPSTLVNYLSLVKRIDLKWVQQALWSINQQSFESQEHGVSVVEVAMQQLWCALAQGYSSNLERLRCAETIPLELVFGPHIKLTQLTHLVIEHSRCDPIDNKVFEAIARTCHHLEVIKIRSLKSSFTHVNLDNITSQIRRNTLRKLVLDCIHDVQLEGLMNSLVKHHSHSLESFKLRNCDLSSVSALAKLDSFPNLRSVKITRCSCLNDQVLASLALIPIQCLDVSETNVGMDFIQTVIRSSRASLRKLNVAHTKIGHTEELFKLISYYCPSITHLDIGGLFYNYVDVTSMVISTSKLKSLSLGCAVLKCPLQADRMIMALLQDCANIENLEISGSHITPASLVTLSRLPNLQKVSLSFCRNITEHQAKGLLESTGVKITWRKMPGRQNAIHRLPAFIVPYWL
ncbi:RNI-like protein [Basidiobolus meristosporus CBS 931.73]|uniref:RNI-like protein n=1 Tax=Basidiobolus meristosporus CBS 931.73 TaxID=1314790 RepID=A0A1Y1XVL2_9FUNG|nr:RNI-like protein [Basidiobolus meristosporus CBS 931.73]|eukprot:ORX89800.1 RNI-like protein [Basidiobolus meristosporus CBS 931.73]